MSSGRRKRVDLCPSTAIGLVALLTDFGQQDHYVGVMKAVMARVFPSVRFIDITHEIPPQDVTAASLHLTAAYPYFPDGTVFLVVVDPGVGSRRRAIVIETRRHWFVAPDNGVLSPVITAQDPYRIYAVTNRSWCLKTISNTFHGRDVFAPVAARLAAGQPARDVGVRIEDPVVIPAKEAERKDGRIRGRILWIDRFGNAVTDIPASLAPKPGCLCVVRLGRRVYRVPVVRAYTEVPVGRPLLIVGSLGWLELSVREGSACETLRVKRGETIVLQE